MNTSTLDNKNPLYDRCHIAIVGGGIAGTYLAMRLSKKYGSKVCLLDKDKHTGGRLYGIPVNPKDSQSPEIGLGGRRVLASQEVMMNLAKELSIVMQKPKPAEEFCFARGKYQFTTKNEEKDVFAKLYGGLPINQSLPDYDYQLMKRLLNGPERKNIEKHPDLKCYIESVVGEAGYQFIIDMTRFKSDYTYPLAAHHYVDWLETEYSYGNDPRYPVGGMSQFVKKLALQAEKFGAQIFKSERVISINKDKNKGYHLTTSNRKILANKVIFAIPAQALSKIHGDVADAIRSKSPLEYIIGVKVLTITQWYEHAWWNGIKRFSNGRRVWRVWTTDSCIRSLEIPQEPYLSGQKVFRVSYSDDINCIQHFQFLETTNYTKLQETIRNGLKHLFEYNGITTPIRIPWPTRMILHEWPDAWYWLKAGSPFSSSYIANWASEPIEGENVGLASDSYFLIRSSWSEGAILSAMKLLKRQYSDVIYNVTDYETMIEQALKPRNISLIEPNRKPLPSRRNPRS